MYSNRTINSSQEIPPIIFSVMGDVNGDGYPDFVFLTGIKTPDSPFIQEITLYVQEAWSGQITQIPLKTNAGYNPTLVLGDFTNDGVMDILVSIASGGSGGFMYYYIYSDLSDMPRLLFDYESFNREHNYRVTYQNDYEVEVVNLTNSLWYLIDISQRDPEYIQEIYDTDGNLKNPIEGFVNPIGGLYPIDYDSNGVYELLIYQKVAGRYNADSLGYLQTILKWDNYYFAFSEQYLAVFGAHV